MRRQTFLLVAVCLAAWTIHAQSPLKSPAQNAVAVKQVGSLGDPATLRIAGCELIPESALRDAIRGDMGIQVASGPAAALDEYLSTLQLHVYTGYLRSGFPFAEVDARFDEQAGVVALQIREGSRHTRGQIRVIGAKSIPVDALVQRLQAPTPREMFQSRVEPEKGEILIGPLNEASPKPQVRWQTGEPAQFDPMARLSLDRAVRATLSELGYFRTRFTTELVPANGQAELHIHIEDEGPRAEINSIDVAGLKRNEPAAVLALLDLSRGEPIDLSRMQRAQEMLWESGRFILHIIRARVGADGKTDLRIDLVEHVSIPLLTQDLPPIAQTLMKTRLWLQRLHESEDELAIDLQENESYVRFIVSSKHGFLLRGNLTELPVMKHLLGEQELNLGVVATTANVELLDLSGGGRFVIPLAAGGGGVVLDVVVTPAFDIDLNHWQRFRAGWGFNTQRAPGEPPIQIQVTIAPVMIYSMIYDGKLQFEADEQVLRFTGEGAEGRIDLATGRLLEATEGKQGASTIRIRSGRGIFEQERAALNEIATEQLDIDLREAAVPLAEMLMRLTLAQSNLLDGEPPARQRAADAIARLFAPPLVQTVHLDLVPYLDATTSNEFHIPLSPASPQAAGQIGMLASFLVPFADELAPRGSWAWTIWRETLLMFAGVRGSAERELSRLMRAENTGPLACLALARSPLAGAGTAHHLAQLGMDRLSREAFMSDVHLLVDNQTLLSKLTLRLAANLREIDEQQLRTILADLPAGLRPLVRDLASELRSDPQRPMDQALRAALEAVWEPHFKPLIEAELQRILQPIDAPQFRL